MVVIYSIQCGCLAKWLAISQPILTVCGTTQVNVKMHHTRARLHTPHIFRISGQAHKHNKNFGKSATAKDKTRTINFQMRLLPCCLYYWPACLSPGCYYSVSSLFLLAYEWDVTSLAISRRSKRGYFSDIMFFSRTEKNLHNRKCISSICIKSRLFRLTIFFTILLK